MKSKAIAIGLLAGFCLLAVYFIIMWLATKSMASIQSQFYDLWYWILLLTAGFGTQMGLFVYLKAVIKRLQAKHATAYTATSTGTSTIGMIACCAHHLTGVLPIIGLSGFAIFLTNYQIPLIIFGIIMNIGGIIYLLQIIMKIHE